MKTEFNVERVCERVQLCVVDAPDDLGPANIEVRGGSIYVSFPSVVREDGIIPAGLSTIGTVTITTEAIEPVAKLVPGEIKPFPQVVREEFSNQIMRRLLDAEIRKGPFITKTYTEAADDIVSASGAELVIPKPKRKGR